MKTYPSRRQRIAKQHKVKLLPSWLMLEFYAALLTSFLLASFFATYIVHTPKVHAAGVKHARVHTLPKTTPAVTPTLTPEREQIDAYIKEVFGKDADKAFLLLTCENSSHNSDLENTAGNYPQGSRDIGVFMINEYWQQVNPKFLYNWKINVDIAHQLYEENDASFKIWTCGRNLGI